jgi:hypothetical protein
MKSTETFKNIILAKLHEMAAKDSLFKVAFHKATKNIDDCITYILNTVKASGCNGFADDEIFGMAAHYYDEDTIDPGKPIDCKVVVNHHAEPDPEPTPQSPTHSNRPTNEKIEPKPQSKPISNTAPKKSTPADFVQGSLF